MQHGVQFTAVQSVVEWWANTNVRAYPLNFANKGTKMPATLSRPAPLPPAVDGRWTYKDYLKLDDEHRYEIINGELCMAPAPGLGHQSVSSSLFFRMFGYAKRHHQLGKLLHAPVDVILSAREVVQPDLVFIHKDRLDICQERGVFGAPDVIVEIISPTSITRDRHSKLKIYRKHGVKEYWLVDPANRSVEVLGLNAEGEYDLRSSAVGRGRVKSEVLAGFSVNIKSIFSE